jgi:hypothetical protein
LIACFLYLNAFVAITFLLKVDLTAVYLTSSQLKSQLHLGGTIKVG